MKMLSVEERLKQTNERLERQARQERIACRQKRETEKKARQRRNYEVGETVLKYFPQLEQTSSLEQFFSEASSDPRIMEIVEALLVKFTSKSGG